MIQVDGIASTGASTHSPHPLQVTASHKTGLAVPRTRDQV